MAGLFLSWDLFDGGKAWYENEKYEIEAQRFRTLVVDALNTISTGIRRALYSLAEAEQRIAASTSALDAAEKNYQAEDNRLKAGVSTITALLDAQSRLVRAQVNAANAAFDYRLAQSELKLMTARPENW
jgi:outer membrane protein TolC